MSEVTYEEALIHFQAQTPMWDALCAGLRARRESKWSDLKRNMDTPTCNQKADDKLIGAMIECDDLLYEFETQRGARRVERDLYNNAIDTSHVTR